MATVDVPRPKRPATGEPATPPKRKSWAFRYGSLAMLVLLIGTTYLAPMIVANTPLRDWVLQAALKLDGTVSLGSLSLGWFSSVVAEDLEIRDAAGDALVKVAMLRTDKPLIGLLLDLSDLGLLHVERPELHVVARDKDTNIEQVFASLLSNSPDTAVGAQLEITDGTIAIDDTVTDRKFRIENLAVTCAIAADQSSLTISASGALADPQQPGSFKIEISTEGTANNGLPLASGKIDCQSSGLPLELAEPLARRTIDKVQLTGRLSTRLAGAWGQAADGSENSVSGQVLVTGLDVAAPAIGNDRIRLDRLEAPCHIVQAGDQVRVEQLSVTCELGSLSITGSAKLSDLSAADKLSALAHENYEVKGNLDLTQLARLLPETLCLRQGTEITSGQIALVASSREQEGGMSWTGHIDASHLGAQANGRALVWENPLAIDFATHETKDGMILDRADCTSSFLTINGSGSIDNLAASATFDLAQLMTELRQFADFDQLQLAGQGQAQLVWKRTADDHFDAEAGFQASGFQLVVAQSRPWKENKLVAKLNAGGQLTKDALKRIDSALVTLDAGGEHFQAELQEAVSDPATAVWPLKCMWSGQLSYWAQRLESGLGIVGWNLGGAGKVQAAVHCSSKAIEIDQAKAAFTQFQAWGNGWFVSEPALSLAMVGQVDFDKSRIEIAQGQLTAGGTSASINHAALQSNADGWTLDGGAAQLAAELADIYRWRHDPRTPAAWQISGKLTGEADVKYQSGAVTGRVDGAVDGWQIIDRTRAVAPGEVPAAWREPRITLAASGNFQTATRQLQLEKVQVAADAVQCDASGTVAVSDTGNTVDVKGTIQYDWAQLAPLWRPLVGGRVDIAGRQTRAFSLHGMLGSDPTKTESWRQMTGEAAVGWTGMNVAGLVVGPGEVAVQLADGRLLTKPIDVDVSQGRLSLAAAARLIPAPAEVALGGGPLLTDVQLSPELCAQGLKFVAPILAESTVADGRFSIVMDGGRFPLSQPMAGDTSGRMALRAQAQPGPVAQQFLILLTEMTTLLRQGTPAALNGQSGALVSIDDANIEFRMVNGRIYHRNLTFTVGTTPITTHGSVGFDESLAIVAEVPIRAKLLGIDLSLGLLEGQTLQIPIEGTLGKPKLELRVLDQLGGQLLKNAARGTLINEVKKTIEKLIPSQQ
jgi:hypothetical protein